MAGCGGGGGSSSTSGIFFHGGDEDSQAFLNSSNCGGPYHLTTMISTPNPSASSILTDANSNLQRSASINNNESYLRLPASPLSFSSSSVVVDGTIQQRGGSSATSLPTSHSQQPRKKPRVDSKQDDVLQQQILRQWLQRQDMLQLQQQSQNPNFQLLLQQQKLRQQQQQYIQSLPPLQRAQLQQQQQVQQQQQLVQQQQGIPRVYDNSVCARRLMQYLYHQRQRPAESSIVYWRKFVNEYFSPRAKKRWCLSHYDSTGQNAAFGVSPQASTDEWQCDLCGSKSGRGFEATFDILPRLNEIKFASGVIDELLYLGVPTERRYASGVMMLEYGKAVQESVYEHIRVIREGHLRILFSQELKILSWEFCTRRHEELLPRRVVAPQVNQLLQVAEKCQSTINQSGSDGIHQQDLQANSNMVMAAGRQLAKSLESHSLNDLGFSKRYVRCLQISEVVSSMKDMIDFCRDQKVGPIEALKSYPYRMKGMEQLARGVVPTDRNSSLMTIPPPMSNMSGQGSAPNAFALANYQTMLMKQKQMNSEPTVQQEPSRNPSPSPSYQRLSSPLLPGFVQSPSPQRQMPSCSYTNGSVQQYNQQQQPSCNNNNQAMEQQMIHQIWQQMANGQQQQQQQQAVSGQNMNIGKSRIDYEPAVETPNRFKGIKGLDQEGSTSLNFGNNNNNGFFSGEVDESLVGYQWKA